MPENNTETDAAKTADNAAKTRDIIRALQCVVDPRMRPAVLGDRLLALEDDEILEVISLLHAMAYEGSKGAREAWSTLTGPGAFIDRLDKFRKSRLYHKAIKKKYEAVPALFSKGRAARGSDGEGQNFQVYGLADLSLGERMSKARQIDRGTRTKAGFDIDPKVISNILLNSRTTESDVLKIASRRPNDVAVLETIFHSNKWISRYQVKISIARNPYTPSNIARNLLPQLLQKDLLEIRYDSALHMEVRKAAQEIIDLKRRQMRPQ